MQVVGLVVVAHEVMVEQHLLRERIQSNVREGNIFVLSLHLEEIALVLARATW